MRSASSSSGSRGPRARWSFHLQAERRGRESRNDLARLVSENRRHEEATVHLSAGHRAPAPRGARGRHRDGRLMLSTAVALPLALLPLVSLVGTLGWMARS